MQVNTTTNVLFALACNTTGMILHINADYTLFCTQTSMLLCLHCMSSGASSMPQPGTFIVTILLHVACISWWCYDAATSTVQVNYYATLLWAALDAYAPAAWNTYSPAIIAELTAAAAAGIATYVSNYLVGLSVSQCSFCDSVLANLDLKKGPVGHMLWPLHLNLDTHSTLSARGKQKWECGLCCRRPPLMES